MPRGIEHRKIILNDKDCEDALERLAKLFPETKTACCAWVLFLTMLIFFVTLAQ